MRDFGPSVPFRDLHQGGRAHLLVGLTFCALVATSCSDAVTAPPSEAAPAPGGRPIAFGESDAFDGAWIAASQLTGGRLSGEGRCLLSDGSTQHRNASALVIGYCASDGENGRWWLPAPGATAEIRALGTLCVDDGSGDPADGDRVLVFPCNGGRSQQWTRTLDGEFRSANGKCMDVAGWQTALGTPVILWPCHGGDNQRWVLHSLAVSPIVMVNEHSGLCLDVSGWSREAGAKVIVWTCHGGENQQFTRPPNRTVDWFNEVRTIGNLCLDDAGGRGLNGDPIITWYCWGGPPQRWQWNDDGSIRGINGRCLDVAGWGTEPGTEVILWDCHGGANQRWRWWRG